MQNSIIPIKPGIRDKIHIIHNVQIILDEDLANLYGVPTKRLNEQVKRNKKKISGKIYVPIIRTRTLQLEVTKCDLKMGRAKKQSIC